MARDQAAAGVRIDVHGGGEAQVDTGLPVLNRLLNGTDSGHVLEAIFKGLGAALAEACENQEGRR